MKLWEILQGTLGPDKTYMRPKIHFLQTFCIEIIDWGYNIYQPIAEILEKEPKSKQKWITLNDGILIQQNKLGHPSDCKEQCLW